MKAAATAIPLLQDKVDLIDTLKEHSGFDNAVGPHVPFLPDFTRFGSKGGDAQGFISGVSRLIQRETLDALIDLKAAGGTLGALSDNESRMLREAASQIGTWEIRDENGKVKGYNIDQATFEQELDRLKEFGQIALNRARGTVISDDESSLLDDAFPSINPAILDPGSFFNSTPQQ